MTPLEISKARLAEWKAVAKCAKQAFTPEAIRGVNDFVNTVARMNHYRWAREKKK